MAEIFSVTVEEIIKQLNMEIIYAPENISSLVVTENDCNRPGLQLMGFYEYFNPERMQIIGKMEFAYLSTIDETTRYQRLDMLLSQHIPALIISRELPYFSEMLELAKKYEVPLLRSKESTSNFIAGLIAFLNMNLAPRITRHGGAVSSVAFGSIRFSQTAVPARLYTLRMTMARLFMTRLGSRRTLPHRPCWMTTGMILGHISTRKKLHRF